MLRLSFIAPFALLALLAACAQPEPPVIRGELLYDKLGNPEGCVEGVFIPGAPPELQCRPPDDVCEGNPFLSTNDPQCPPRRPRQPEGEGGDDPNRNPQVPGAGPNNPAVN